VNAYGINGELDGRTPLGGIKHPFSLEPANSNGVLSKTGVIPFGVDPLSGSGPLGIHTSSGKLDPHCVINLDGPTQVCHEKFTIDTNPILSVSGVDSYAVGKKKQSGVSAEYDEGAGWGTDVYQEDARRLREQSGECVAEDDFDALCTTNTEINSRVIVSKESAELDAQGLGEKKKRKRIVSLNPTVTWDNGTTSKVKQLSDYTVMRRVRRKSEATTAPPEDTSVRSEDEVRDEESARVTRERRLLNESCSAKMLTHLRDSIHSDPESGLLYWVSRSMMIRT